MVKSKKSTKSLHPITHHCIHSFTMKFNLLLGSPDRQGIITLTNNHHCLHCFTMTLNLLTESPDVQGPEEKLPVPTLNSNANIISFMYVILYCKCGTIHKWDDSCFACFMYDYVQDVSSGDRFMYWDVLCVGLYMCETIVCVGRFMYGAFHMLCISWMG